MKNKKPLNEKIVNKVFENLSEYVGFSWFNKCKPDIKNEILQESYKSVKRFLIRNHHE